MHDQDQVLIDKGRVEKAQQDEVQRVRESKLSPTDNIRIKIGLWVGGIFAVWCFIYETGIGHPFFGLFGGLFEGFFVGLFVWFVVSCVAYCRVCLNEVKEERGQKEIISLVPKNDRITQMADDLRSLPRPNETQSESDARMYGGKVEVTPK